MTEETKWRIEELTTEGWTLLSDTAVGLSKDKCDVLLDQFLQSGVNQIEIKQLQNFEDP